MSFSKLDERQLYLLEVLRDRGGQGNLTYSILDAYLWEKPVCAGVNIWQNRTEQNRTKMQVWTRDYGSFDNV